MGVGQKLEAELKPPGLPPQRKPESYFLRLVYALAGTAILIALAITVILCALTAWSLYSWRNMFAETITFIKGHPREEIDALARISTILITNSIILLMFLYSQFELWFTGRKKNEFASHSKCAIHRRLELWKTASYSALFISYTWWAISSIWNTQYLPLVDERLAKPHHLFGTRAEAAFLSTPNSTIAIEASRTYATKPHMAGTVGDLATAREFLSLLQRELGISDSQQENLVFDAGSVESQRATRSVSTTSQPYAWIDTYYPVMNTPKERILEIVDEDGATLLTTSLVEFSDPTDPDANKYSDDVPTFHGLSQGGDVTGPLVDGNYCTYEDYQQLVQNNIEVNGSIVLCRYGGIFRGLKVKGGQDLGAVGVLIYSDPRDDGTVTNARGYASYPYGPARNPTSVQRGSVQYLSVYPGDPTTPGYPSYENSTRTEGDNIPKIPSLPISWTNANLMFRTFTKGDELEGKHVRLVNNVDTRVIPIWNTMGVIPGYIRDEVVVVGNHRDAWVLGATDPSSGTVSVHEVVRGLGHLLRNGWKPLRTILIASWDAEEYGLIGSTEWGEDFGDWVDAHVVAYLNLDSSVSGSRLRASGSPLLAHFIRATAEELPHPTESGSTLWDATTDDGTLFGLVGDHSISQEVVSMHKMRHTAADSVGVAPLGSGSDYTVFLQRSGVPCTNGGFGSTLHDPVYHYHSIFDSERWQELWADPGFFRHVAVAKHLGLQTLRLTTSPILPFNTTHYAYEIEAYLNEAEILALTTSLDVNFAPLRKSIQALQKASIFLEKEKIKAHKDLQELLNKWKKRHSALRKIARKVRKVLCRLRKVVGRKCSCPHKGWHNDLDMKATNEIALGMLLHEDPEGDLELARLSPLEISRDYHHKFPLRKLRKVVKHIRELNKKSAAIEKGFISEEGIKDREWYKHLVVAPGKWLGYGATTLPGISEAIQYEKNVTLAQYEVGRLQGLVDQIVATITD